jgi:hypothetical protein
MSISNQLSSKWLTGVKTPDVTQENVTGFKVPGFCANRTWIPKAYFISITYLKNCPLSSLFNKKKAGQTTGLSPQHSKLKLI